ncbi:hypothetical protein GWI34_00010 [Actinomadura sp. DSM 109109]|nr:hypothetical protein [Actinomadura lepetitiana]
MLRRRTLTLLEPRRALSAVARRPVGTSALLGTPRPAPALERLVPLPGTSFALAFEAPPSRTALFALIAAALERTILRASLEASLPLAAAALEAARPPFPPGPAPTLTRTRRAAVRRPAVPAFTTLTGEPVIPALTTLAGEPAVPALAGEPPLSALAALTRGSGVPALATLTTEPVVLTLATLTTEPAVLTLATLTTEPVVLTLAALAGEPARSALTALAGGSGVLALPALTAETALRAPFPCFGTPVVGTLEGAAGLAVITLAARIPFLPAARTAASALRAAGAESPAAGAAALTGTRPSLTAAGIAPATGGCVTPPVAAPPLAAVVAAAVLFRAHHVRHCS